MKRTAVFSSVFCAFVTLANAASSIPDGWQTAAPRDEIRPAFSFDATGGPNHAGSFVITHDERDGLDGWFQKSFTVNGGQFYRFFAVRKTSGVRLARRCAVVRVLWQNEDGRKVSADVAEELGHVPSAEAEYPADGAADSQGWTELSGVYRAPSKATRAVVELHLQWAPNGRVEWSNVQFDKSPSPAARKVRLATIHYKPSGNSPRQN